MKKIFLHCLFILSCGAVSAQGIRDDIQLTNRFGQKQGFEFSSPVQDDKTISPVPALKNGTSSLNIGSIPGYDGVEATVVKGDDIYFHAEASKDSGYIIKGKISGNSPNRIITLTKRLGLGKPAPRPADQSTYANDGFESLVIFNKKLMAFYERKYGNPQYLISIPIFCKPLNTRVSGLFNEDRLSDIALSSDGSTLVAITMTYDGGAPANDVYLLEELNGNIFSDSLLLSSGKPDLVWEGITGYKDGYLLINDNYNDGHSDFTKLLYVKKAGAGN